MSFCLQQIIQLFSQPFPEVWFKGFLYHLSILFPKSKSFFLFFLFLWFFWPFFIVFKRQRLEKTWKKWSQAWSQAHDCSLHIWTTCLNRWATHGPRSRIILSITFTRTKRRTKWAKKKAKQKTSAWKKKLQKNRLNEVDKYTHPPTHTPKCTCKDLRWDHLFPCRCLMSEKFNVLYLQAASAEKKLFFTVQLKFIEVNTAFLAWVCINWILFLLYNCNNMPRPWQRNRQQQSQYH